MFTIKSISRTLFVLLVIVMMLTSTNQVQATGVSANNLAATASHWSALGSGMNGTVYALVFDGSGNLYAGGNFTTAGGTSANNIAKWDGTSWSALGSGINGTVSALVFDGSGNLYAGGSFTTAGGANANYIAKWDGSSWSALGSGMNGTVYALAFDGSGNLYAGGYFTTAGGTSANYVAKWDGSSWSTLGSGMSSTVRALAFDGSGNLYAGGDFTTAGGTSANYVAKWDGSSWFALGSGMNNLVYALAVNGSGNLYVMGNFTAAGGVSANYVAKWDGSSWSTLGSGMNGSVSALVFDGSGNLYAGGYFTTAGGANANNVAKWDGSSWSALGSGMNGAVSALAFDGSGNLYTGGSFTTVGGTSANYIAKDEFLPTPGGFSKTSPINNAQLQSINPSLSWGTSELATSYAYCYDTIDDNLCNTSWVSTDLNTSANLSALSYNTTYYWQVEAINADGSTYANDGNWWNFNSGSFLKTSPINNARQQSINSTLRWGTSELATSYAYCYDTINNNVCDTSWVSTSLNTSANLSDLSYNTTYYWQVKAINGDGTTYLSSNDWWNFSTSVIWFVTSASSSGTGSLRSAISSAASGDIITFDASLSGATIWLSSPLTINNSITIDGSNLSSRIQISGQNTVRVMEISSSVMLKNLTIRNGYKAPSYSGGGGGIFSTASLSVIDCNFSNNYARNGGAIALSNSSSLSVTRSTFTNNTASWYPDLDYLGHGGAIYGPFSKITVVDSTFSNNSVTGQGGGIYSGPTITIRNSSFFGNQANGFWYNAYWNKGKGGGIFNLSSTSTITSSTFSNNSAESGGGIFASTNPAIQLTNSILANSTSGGDCFGASGASGSNLIEDGSCSPTLTGDPNLGPLTDNGGPTWTFALLPGSRAIDAGSTFCYPATDQRGITRPQGTRCDIGAFELKQFAISGNAGVSGVKLSYTNGSSLTATSGSNGSYSFFVPTGWAGTITPSLAGYTFSPANLDYGAAPVTTNLTGQDFISTLNTYTISGNAGVTGATLNYTGGTTTADESGNYTITVSYGWTGSVTPSKLGNTFSPDHLDYTTPVAADQTVQNYAAFVTISGNAGMPNASLSYTGGTTTADGSGHYSFTVAYGWTGTVTPSLAGYIFSPVQRDYTTPITASLSSENYTALVTISGNAGLGGATLSYNNGSPQTATADDRGNYSIAVPYNWSGTITPSKAGYLFTPAHLTYINVLANQTDQNFTVTFSYTISGNAGMSGASLSYPDGTPVTAGADGSYSISVPSGWSGTITPSLTGYIFSPSNYDYSAAPITADLTSQDFIPTAVATDTPTPTDTHTPTATETFTPPPTETLTPTANETDTLTPTITPTSTPTPSITPAPTATETFTPTVTPTSANIPLPDLVVTSMQIELETGGACNFSSTNLGVRVWFKNNGDAAAGPFVVEVNGLQQTFASGLAAGQGGDLWFANYNYMSVNTATVDATDQVAENNEANNQLSQMVPVPTLPPTCTPTVTLTATLTPTPSITITLTTTFTPSFTFTPTNTATFTPTLTKTKTPTPTRTRTMTPTASFTSTMTLTPTRTLTPTITPTRTKTSTPTRTPTKIPVVITLQSAGSYDGWVLESSEISNVGGTFNATLSTFNLGDDAGKRQYRGILSFSTGSLPDNAIITSVMLKVRQQAILGGGNPVTMFQGFMADVKNGSFGTPALQTSDFQAAASASYGPFITSLVGGWYNINLSSAKLSVNKLATNSGLTQIRLRFVLDDNNNAVANYLSLYSGNAPTASRPQLMITYYVP